MFNLFNRKRVPAEAARQLTLSERRSLSYPTPVAGGIPFEVFDRMQKDAMIQTSLGVKRGGVLAAPFRIEPDGAPAERVRFIEEAFDRMQGSPLTILDAAMDAFAKGWSVQEVVLKADGGRIWIEAVRPKDPALFGLDFDAFGKLQGLRLSVPGEAERELPLSRFVVWAYRQGYKQPRGRSDLEAAHPHWTAKQSLLAAWKLHLERFAMPTVLGKYQRGLSMEEQSALSGALENLLRSVSILYPGEVEISTLGGQRETSAGFMDAIEFHNREIARAILGQTLTTDEGRRVGSLALGKVHLQVLLLQLESLRRELADRVMTEQVIRPLVALNFGSGRSPRFVFDSVPLDMFASGKV